MQRRALIHAEFILQSDQDLTYFYLLILNTARIRSRDDYARRHREIIVLWFREIGRNEIPHDSLRAQWRLRRAARTAPLRPT